MKIVADNGISYIQDYFAQDNELILLPGRALQAADVKDADALIVRSITHVNKALLSGSKVKFVGSVTAGADHLDTAWLEAENIKWCVAAGFNAPPVADYVVSVVAALQSKQVLKPENKRAAVIGVGHAGSLVVERLKLLGYEVLTCDPLRAKREPDFQSTPLEDIHDVDLISLHVPLIKTGEYATYHFIDSAFLKRQKPGCVLLNAARGAVIDSEALLKDGKHLFWCFDVWEYEPIINKALLERAFIATPHIAGYSVQSKMRGIDMIYQLGCANHFFSASNTLTHAFPQQTLSFASLPQSWHSVVLGIFNPLVMTAMLRTVLLPVDNVGQQFDEMRHAFNYRHEFAYTEINELVGSEEDERVLRGLGIKTKAAVLKF